MNEEIILEMVKPYIFDSAVTYDDFENVFSILSRKEQYAVVDILYHRGINLIDKKIDDNKLILDVDDVDDSEDYSEESNDHASGFEKRYDERLFQDRNKELIVLNKNIKQSNEILCSLIQQGNQQALQDLCIKNKKLIDKYAASYEKKYGNHLDFEDLEQVGYMGLITAAQKYNSSLGTSFSTYAVYWIKQAISREILNNGYAIRIPVHMMELIRKVISVDGRLMGKDFSFQERIERIAEECGVPEELVQDCFVINNTMLSYASLDTPIGEDEESLMGDFIPADEEYSVENVVMRKELRNELARAMKTLTKREQKVLELRFGWEDGRPRTLEEVGVVFNVTRERIRQIEAKALRKLRHPSRLKAIKQFWEE